MRLLPCSGNYFLFNVFLLCGLICLAGKHSPAAETESAEYRGMPTLWAGDSPSEASPIIVNVSKQVYRLVVQTDGLIKGGTAFLVSGNRVIATNNHVVEKGTAYALGYIGEQGQIRWVKLELLAVFPQKDLALLQAVENLPGQALPLAADFPELASDLYAIGFPAAADLGGEIGPVQTADRNFVLPSVLKGNISRVMTGAWLTNQLQHQTPISPGYSGGPLVDNHGIVVGISTAINKEASGISYGVASPDLARFLTACALPPRTVYLHRYSILDVRQTTGSISEPTPKQPAPNQAVLKRAYQMLGRGDIAGARTTFEYAAQKGGSREAYEGLAKTYDPAILQYLRVIGDLADAKKARQLYEQAAQVGDDRASSPQALAAPGCDNSMCMMLDGGSGAPTVLCSKTSERVAFPH